MKFWRNLFAYDENQTKWEIANYSVVGNQTKIGEG